MKIHLSEALTLFRKRNNLSLPALQTATEDTASRDNKQQLEFDQSTMRSSLAPTNYTTNTEFEMPIDIMMCPSPKSMIGQEDMLYDNFDIAKK